VEVDEDGGFDQEHAEGSFLTVPCGGLPHEEPLAADGDEGYQPEEHSRSECSGA